MRDGKRVRQRRTSLHALSPKRVHVAHFCIMFVTTLDRVLPFPLAFSLLLCTREMVANPREHAAAAVCASATTCALQCEGRIDPRSSSCARPMKRKNQHTFHVAKRRRGRGLVTDRPIPILCSFLDYDDRNDSLRLRTEGNEIRLV